MVLLQPRRHARTAVVLRNGSWSHVGLLCRRDRLLARILAMVSRIRGVTRERNTWDALNAVDGQSVKVCWRRWHLGLLALIGQELVAVGRRLRRKEGTVLGPRRWGSKRRRPVLSAVSSVRRMRVVTIATVLGRVFGELLDLVAPLAHHLIAATRHDERVLDVVLFRVACLGGYGPHNLDTRGTIRL